MRTLFGRAAQRGRRVGLGLSVAVLAGLTSLVATVPYARSASAPASTSGYWLVGTDGGIFSFGNAGFLGSTGALTLNQPIVGMAATPDGRGYWMVASDGGIFAFGDAAFYGSMGGKPLNQPIVGMAATHTGRGYWLVASDGGIFAFGDAVFYGSMGATHLNKPIVGIAPTPDGRGYWMSASDGGIFSFGDAGFYGSTGAIKLSKRIQAMSPTPDGRGYWLVAGDGGVFAFGDAGFFGSAATDAASDKRVVAIAPSASGQGYYLTASNGAVFAYGDAKYLGSAADQHLSLSHGIIGIVALNSGAPPVTGDDVLSVDEDTPGTVDVLVNDRDPDGGMLTITDVSKPAHGTATFAIGTVGYRPAPNYNGPDSFTYTVTDPQGNTATGTVNVTVRPVNDIPQANADTANVAPGATVTIHVLNNDTGLGDGIAALSLVRDNSNVKVLQIDSSQRPIAITTGAGGSAQVSNDGPSIVYTAPNKKGTDSFTYRIDDNNGDARTAPVHITITGADIAPKAVDVTVPCGVNFCQTDLTTASGINLGDNGTISLVNEQNGVVVNNDGTFTRQGNTVSFAPANGVTTGSVPYQIVDDNNGTAPPQTVTATLTFQLPQNPTATNDGGTAPVGQPLDFHFTAQGPNGDQLTYVIDGATYSDGVNPPSPADSLFQLTDPQKDNVHFTGGPAGKYIVTFHVTDGQAQSNQATYTIQVG